MQHHLTACTAPLLASTLRPCDLRWRLLFALSRFAGLPLSFADAVSDYPGNGDKAAMKSEPT